MSSTQHTENRSICHGIIKQISHTFQRKRYVCTVLDSGSVFQVKMLFFGCSICRSSSGRTNAASTYSGLGVSWILVSAPHKQDAGRGHYHCVIIVRA